MMDKMYFNLNYGNYSNLPQSIEFGDVTSSNLDKMNANPRKPGVLLCFCFVGESQNDIGEFLKLSRRILNS